MSILGKYVPWTVFPRRNCPGGHYFGGTEFPMTLGKHSVSSHGKDEEIEIALDGQPKRPTTT